MEDWNLIPQTLDLLTHFDVFTKNESKFWTLRHSVEELEKFLHNDLRRGGITHGERS
jgi:hypothetical protein